ncbi:hypothetical protein VEE68_18820 [Escherichia coli]|nr:hypothetical protein VEE68_18820 [Escherichia coli]
MSAVLTAEQALKLVGEMFVYHMPFNRALGMELERYEKEFAQLAFKNQPMMVGNWAQSIFARRSHCVGAGCRRRSGVRGKYLNPPRNHQ